MSGKSLVDQIKHYQKDIERCPENSERMIRCIQRLYVLPIQVLHLQETGVGRSVNSLRKYKGEVGEAAKALVAKWKAMVAAEESSDDSNDKLKTKPPDSKLSKPAISTVKVEPKSEKSLVKVEPKSEKPVVKAEPKSEKLDHPSNRDKFNSKDRSSSKEKGNNKDKCSSSSSSEKANVKSHHDSPRHHSESHSSRSSSSVKRPHSTSDKNHSSEKKSVSHKNHKSHYEKRYMSDDEDSPSSKKHKKHHSHSRNYSHSKKEIVESEEEVDEEVADESQDEELDTDRSEIGDSGSNTEKESSEDSENSSFEEEEAGEQVEEHEDEEENDSDSSSSDHRHRSKHKSSHHKHKKSSHSHSDKNKENYKSQKSNNQHSNKKSSSKDLEELIKENEKKIKKEKDEFDVPKYIPTKIVKLERNEDGSIDSGSGASFADALLGVDNYLGQKKKKKLSPSKETSSSSNHKTSSSQKSSSGSSSHKKPHSHSNSSATKEKSKDNSSSRPKTIDELVETPELLTKKVKLEALDLDISSTLPEINPNYKPLPHVPESSRRQTKSMSEEDTMFSIMTTKNQRTKVYSGNKVYQNTIPSLFNLCIQLLYENIDAVEYTGGVPYNLLKPLLERLNSDQLYVIEHFNPYLIEDTDNLWKFHCSKDFRSERRQDLESWRDLYLATIMMLFNAYSSQFPSRPNITVSRCVEERERKLKALTANISQSMAKSTPVRQAKLAYVDSVVKPPRNVARKQAKYGTGGPTSNSKSSTPNNNKQDIVNKAVVGGHTPGVSAKDVVPPPPAPRATHHSTPAILKKKKAPLMQKALQFIKGNRFKR